jgi:hypothetical protein
MENKLRRNMFYTVTATVTTFIKAQYASQAEDILYEALLGNDDKNVLSLAEVHMPVTSQRGVHSTIPVNEDVNPHWAKTLYMKKEIIENQKKETEMDVIAMQSATMNALRLERDKWREIAEKLADAIQDIHYIFPRMEQLTTEYLDLCDEFFGTDRNG